MFTWGGYLIRTLDNEKKNIKFVIRFGLQTILCASGLFK